MSRTLTLSLWIGLTLLLLAAAAPIALYYGLRWYYEPGLPAVESLRELKLEVPLRIQTRDGKLIGEYGAERREPLAYDQLPPKLVQAFVAAEDDRFFEHPGVDWQGLLRAAIKLVLTGEKVQGGSTITMQLARNVFLTPERSYERKIREILLALRIEREMSKEEILEIYLNKIFLGQRAYGVGAASRVYFGIEPHELDWSQAALLAGLPKAPSRDNPVTSPERAIDRRNYVLRRLRQLGHISEVDYQATLALPIEVVLAPFEAETEAHYVSEMVRAEMVERFGEEAYRSGFTVTTTVHSERQIAAQSALRESLLSYEERHGWRGPEGRVPADLMRAAGQQEGDLMEELQKLPRLAGLKVAVALAVDAQAIDALTEDRQRIRIAAADFKWARIGKQRPLVRGDLIRVRLKGKTWRLAQAPRVQGALAAIDPRTGAMEAVVGGYDYFQNKYNRAVQARRQPGSGFKPFVYAAAFDRGLTPATVLADEPITMTGSKLEGTWRPMNSDHKFKGPMRLREALVQSRNLVTIRVLEQTGLNRTREYISRFGLDKKRIPKDLSMALGTGIFTPMEMAEAYAVLANGGYRVEPYLIQSIVDGLGNTLFEAQPPILCEDPCEPAQLASLSESGPQVDAPAQPPMAKRVIDPRVVWLVDDILSDVTTRGTASRARHLGRGDIAGKTGTTNDETDAWFCGFNRELVAVVWMGFDQPAPLGRREDGGRAALPVWMEFMKVALKDQPETPRPRPSGLVNIRINPENGLLAAGGDANAITEVVQEEHVPQMDTSAWGLEAVPVDELF